MTKKVDKVRVAIDMDNTVVDFTGGIREHMRRKLNISRTEAKKRFREPTHYSYADSGWFNNLEDFIENFQEAEENGIYLTSNERKGSIKVLKNLVNDARVDVHIVTARPEKYNSETKQYLIERGIDLPIFNESAKENYDAHLFVDDKDSFAEKLMFNEFFSTDGVKKQIIIPATGYNLNLNPEKNWHNIEKTLNKKITEIYGE